MKNLDKSIKDHFLDKRLSDSAIDRIMAMGEAAKLSGADRQPSCQGKPRQQLIPASRFWWQKTNNWQTASLIFFVAVFLGIFAGQGYHFNSSVTGLVLQEIAMNHNKRLEAEYPANEYIQLKTAMTRLDFELAKPEKLPDNYQLIGGRYCSIQGHIAAQLKVKNSDDGRIATLYVTPITKRLSGISGQEAVQGNVNIKLWMADNYFYGLAADQ